MGILYIVPTPVGNMEDMTYRKRIIDIFVNAVYVYEDKLVFTYNFRDGNETVSLADIKLSLGSHSSDISDSTSPKGQTPIGVYGLLPLVLRTQIANRFHGTERKRQN